MTRSVRTKTRETSYEQCNAGREHKKKVPRTRIKEQEKNLWAHTWLTVANDNGL